jgi:LacI family transcriptional regulator
MDTVNIKHLAKALNLSISTVSRALRDSYDISPKTKERVQQLARELNYQPNPHASSLRHQKSKTIAVVIPEIANHFFTLAINGIESVAQEKGYHVLIYITHEDVTKEEAFLKHLQSGRVDGVIISLSTNTNDYTALQNLQQKGIPIVLFDRVYEPLHTYKVTTDDFNSAYVATSHLIERGCDKVAYLMISKNASISMKRMEGYRKAMSDHKLPIDERWIIYGSNDNAKNLKLIKELLQGDNRPNGLFASVERLAMTAYQACYELDLKIPNDVKIISFSNIEIADLLNPSLTTITQPAYDMGSKAASLLFTALGKKNSTLHDESFVLQSSLQVRMSTGGL